MAIKYLTVLTEIFWLKCAFYKFIIISFLVYIKCSQNEISIFCSFNLTMYLLYRTDFISNIWMQTHSIEVQCSVFDSLETLCLSIYKLILWLLIVVVHILTRRLRMICTLIGVWSIRTLGATIRRCIHLNHIRSKLKYTSL